MTNYPSYYLTSGGSLDGSNAYWGAYIGDDTQLWSCTEISDITSNELTMPVNINQKYCGHPEWIKEYGCAVCCQADVASYYGGITYTVQNMINAGAATESDGAIWTRTPSALFRNYSIGSFLTKIKAEIDDDKPVVVHLTNSDYSHNHWVVAFKYVNSAATFDDVYVLDPANTNSDYNGAIRTLSASMQYSIGIGSIYQLMLTDARPHS